MTKRFLLVLAAMGIHGRLSAEQKNATLTRHFPDGTSDTLAPATIRQRLYGLSIDPASAAGMGLLAQAMIDAPRSLGQRTLGAGQGSFGGS